MIEPIPARRRRSGDALSDPRDGSSDLDTVLRAALNGDEHAFRIVFRDLNPRLVRYLRALVGADAEDVAAEAWSQIARDHRSFRGDYDKFRGWASSIARNRAIDFLRHRGRRPEVPAPVEEMVGLAGHDRAAQEALDRIVTGDAVEMITTLPRPMAEAVLLRVVMGMDAKQAGRVLGKSPGAVRTAAYRGLRELAERLKAESGTAETERPAVKEKR